MKSVLSLLGLLSLEACEKPVISYSVLDIPIDQVFRQSRGYKILSTDLSGRIYELDYTLRRTDCGTLLFAPQQIKNQFISFPSDKEDPRVVLFRDVSNDKQSYAKVLEYQAGCFNRNNLAYYVEIHLASHQDINPGIEDIRTGKFIRHEPMQEIK
ncbi:MAG: hypothetical protein Q8R18_02340 [bacterium]|nr:hypothetical protein [bacterium]